MGWIFFLSSLQAEELGPDPGIPHLDKLVHATLYAVLVLSLHPPASARRVPGEWLPGALAAAGFFAITDELHQFLVPGRSPDPWDLVADGVGMGLAVAAGRSRWLAAWVCRILP